MSTATQATTKEGHNPRYLGIAGNLPEAFPQGSSDCQGELLTLFSPEPGPAGLSVIWHMEVQKVVVYPIAESEPLYAALLIHCPAFLGDRCTSRAATALFDPRL